MQLEGKAKTEFGNWFLDSGLLIQYNEFKCLNEFYKLDFSMQFGVYQDFFDSVGIYIEIMMDEFNGQLADFYCYDLLGKGTNSRDYTEEVPNRHQAREEAIKKAMQIFNNR